MSYEHKDTIEIKVCPSCQNARKSLLLSYTAYCNRIMWTCLQCGVVFTTPIVAQPAVDIKNQLVGIMDEVLETA